MQLIYQRSPEDTPLLSAIGRKRAANARHEWLTRTRGARAGTAGATVAVAPGADLTDTTIAGYADVAKPSRVVNYCEIFRQMIFIDETTLAMSQHGINDLMADQLEFRATDLAITLEEKLFNGAQNVGPSSTGDTDGYAMDGLRAAITTNSTDATMDTFADTDITTTFNACWAAGGQPQDLYCGPNVKGLIAGLAGNSSTQFLNREGKRIINTVTIYEGATQTVMVHLTRDLGDAHTGLASTSATSAQAMAQLLMVDRNFLSVAWLRDPFMERLPRFAGAELARIEGQCALEYGDEAVHGEIINIQDA